MAVAVAAYCASHVPVQSNFRRYYFYFLPDQAQILLDHFNVLDELDAKFQLGSTTDKEFPHRPQL